MKALILFAVLLPDAEPAPKNPSESLETAIPHGIKLLEAKKHEEFIKTFIEPDALKKFTADPKRFADLVAGFGGEKADALLKALKEVKGEKPELVKDGKVAKFKLKTPIGGRDEIAFVKVGKTWHISN